MALRESRVGQRERRRVWERDEGICWLCREPVLLDHAEVDHVIPLSQDGQDVDANTRITHWRCNRVRAGRVSVTSLPVGTAGDKPPPWARRHEWNRGSVSASSEANDLRTEIARLTAVLTGLTEEREREQRERIAAEARAADLAERLAQAEAERDRLAARRWYDPRTW